MCTNDGLHVKQVPDSNVSNVAGGADHAMQETCLDKPPLKCSLKLDCDRSSLDYLKLPLLDSSSTSNWVTEKQIGPSAPPHARTMPASRSLNRG